MSIPAKAEVRFRDAALVRGLIVGALRQALTAAGHRASTTVADAALAAFRPGRRTAAAPPMPYAAPGLAETAAAYEAQAPLDSRRRADAVARAAGAPRADDADAFPLGAALAQLHETYVVAQTGDGIVIVDQHAAHERLVYERMKEALAATGVPRQILLLPEVVELDEAGADAARRARRGTRRARPRARDIRHRRGGGARGAGAAGRARRAAAWCATSPTRSPKWATRSP